MDADPSKLEIINHTDFSFKEDELIKQCLVMLSELEKRYEKTLSNATLCFMSAEDIQNLNNEFLKKDLPTDTLTFIHSEDPLEGDIALCPSIIQADALKDGKNFGEYMAEVVLHSFLHLFGLEHTYEDKDLSRVYELHKEIMSSMSINWRAFHV